MQYTSTSPLSGPRTQHVQQRHVEGMEGKVGQKAKVDPGPRRHFIWGVGPRAGGLETGGACSQSTPNRQGGYGHSAATGDSHFQLEHNFGNASKQHHQRQLDEGQVHAPSRGQADVQ